MLIAELLEGDPGVQQLARMCYPIIAPEKAVCPYIVYRRAGVGTTPTKLQGHADSASIEVMCCGKTYAQSVELAEAVREALDGIQAISDDGTISMRSCLLSDAKEEWDSDTYIQTLTFTARINH